MTEHPRIFFSPIGIIHSPHQEKQKTPIQSVYANGIKGKVEIFPEFTEALKDLDGFSHLYLLYHFNKSNIVKLTVKPYLEDATRGLFATRAPSRPNPIGLSIVKLNSIENNYLFIENIDILDGTPLLDIKPYTAKFDIMDNVKSGWQDSIDNNTARIKGKRDYSL